MKIKPLFTTLLLISLGLHPDNTIAHEEHDPLLTHVILNQLELGDSRHSGAVEAQAWVGHDLNKFWLKTDIEREQGTTHHADIQALYSRAIAPYWDMQLGVRHDQKPVKRNWAVIGLQGVAPYFFEWDSALLIGDSGRVAMRVAVDYDLLLSQRLILSLNLEFTMYGQDDLDAGMGAGLADSRAGLRLRYELRREFAPYIGINWNNRYGKTADIAEARGEQPQDIQWVLGLRAWF